MSGWEATSIRLLGALGLHSIRSRILAFALVATLVPAIGMAWISYVQNRRAITEKIAEELRGVSSQSGREVDLWIKERLYDLRVFTSSYEVWDNLDRFRRNAGTEQARSRLRDYLSSVRERSPEFEELLVTDTQHRVAATSADTPGRVLLPDDWITTVQREEAVVGTPYWDSTLARPVMTMAVPVRAANGTNVGFLLARPNFDTIEAAFAALAPGETGGVYLLDTDGRLITSAVGSSHELMETRLEASTLARLRERSQQPLEYTNHQGADVVGTLAPGPRGRLAVLAEIPQQEAFAQIARLRNATALMVTVMLLAIGLIAYLLGLTIVRPLDRLTRGAGRVAAGDLEVDLPVSGRGEVSYLTEVFNDMVARLRQGRQELERLSVTDSLTGLHNRRHLMSTLVAETHRSQRHKRPFAVLMIDVDHFKQYNDTYGHLAGDEVLERVATVLREETRQEDYAARYGGEEFVVSLPETAPERSLEVAERIRRRMARERFELSRDDKAKITLSIGVAGFPEDGEAPEALLAAADAALYQAKQRGRNRVHGATRRAAKNVNVEEAR